MSFQVFYNVPNIIFNIWYWIITVRQLTLINPRSEAAVQRCFYEKVFWKYTANLQENTHATVQFNKDAKQHYWNRTSAWVCPPVNLQHIFRTPFPKNTFGWLLLKIYFQVLFDKYEWIKSRAQLETPFQKILAIKSSWSIKSNTLERLVNNAPNSFPLSADFLKFSNIASRQSWELYPLRNPHWFDKVFYQNNHTVDSKYVFYKF